MLSNFLQLCYNIRMIIKNAEFLISIANKNQILDLGLSEFVFVGRSNSGKSSLINYLVNQKKLAKTSSTPGHTKLINYFLINNNKDKILEKIKNKEQINEENGFLLVDLPGYGFSSASKSNHKLWADLIQAYLDTSKNIKKVFVLVDIRHEPSDLDKQMIQYLYYRKIPFVILATKADKIAPTKIKQQINIISNNFKLGRENIIPCSTQSKIGKERILNYF